MITTSELGRIPATLSDKPRLPYQNGNQVTESTQRNQDIQALNPTTFAENTLEEESSHDLV